jgi:hypothetical protein
VRVVTIITDYGKRDGYTGVLKTFLASFRGDVEVVEVTSEIPPFDLLSGAVVVFQTMKGSPPGTIHLVVVDPGVGTERGGVVVVSHNQYFVAPDNGVLHFPLLSPQKKVIRISPSLRRRTRTTTFDGRDWFVEVVALLLQPVPLSRLGEETSSYYLLEIPPPIFEPHRWKGFVIHIDHFGNYVSNLPPPPPDLERSCKVFLHEIPVGPIRRGFGEVGKEQWVATIGSLETVEISLREGNAYHRAGYPRGTPVEILFPSPTTPPSLPWE